MSIAYIQARELARSQRPPTMNLRCQNGSSSSLLELQNGRCFYCHKSTRRTAEVDHFIPWSRYPDDGIDNLVVADRRCNGAKRDFLASAGHVERWRGRMEEPEVDEIVNASGWHRSDSVILGVARAIYLRLPRRVRLWKGINEFEVTDPAMLGSALA